MRKPMTFRIPPEKIEKDGTYKLKVKITSKKQAIWDQQAKQQGLYST